MSVETRPHKVIVVGRSPEKMTAALAIVDASGFSATPAFSEEEALAAMAAEPDLFAIVTGGAIDDAARERLRVVAEAQGAALVQAAIGHDDPEAHFATNVIPKLIEARDRTRTDGTVSVLGTGMLGTALAGALLRAGHRVTVWNRTAGKADAVVASGAARAVSPAEAVAASPIVIASVSTYDDVHAVVAGEIDRLAGRTLVNLSSGTPEQARTLAAWTAERGVAYLDGAAMSGTRLVGQPEALFLFSGDPDAYAAHEATLGALGRTVHLGADPGAASVYDTALLAMNMGVLSGFYQAIALVSADGVDAATFASVAVDYLPFVTGLLHDHAHQIGQRHYPGDDGTLEVFAAAMGHIVATGRSHGIDVELPAAITALLERGVAAGHGDDGIARLADVIAGR